MQMEQRQADSSNGSASSLADWKQLGVHEIALPSGAVVKARIPDAGALLRADAMPERLRAIVLLELTHKDGAAGALAEQIIAGIDDTEKLADIEKSQQALDQMQRRLLLEMVVDPALAEDDLDDVPVDDRLMLVGIAQRELAYDALGRRVGVEPLDRWDTFREAHHCPAEGCDACEQARRQLSTVHGG